MPYLAQTPAHALAEVLRGEVRERYGARPDEPCSRARRVTQPAAKRIHPHPDEAPRCFRWSAFHGS